MNQKNIRSKGPYGKNSYRTKLKPELAKPELKLWKKNTSIEDQKKVFKDFWLENKYNSKINAWEEIDSSYYDYEFKIKDTNDFFYIYPINAKELPEKVTSIVNDMEELLQLSHQTLMLKNTNTIFIREDGDRYALLIQQSFFTPNLAKARKRFVDVMSKNPNISSFYTVNVRPFSDFKLFDGSTKGKSEVNLLKGNNYLVRNTENANGEAQRLFLHPLDRAHPVKFESQLAKRIFKAINPSKTDQLLHLYSSSAHSSLLLAPYFQKNTACDIRKVCEDSITKSQKHSTSSKIKFINTKVTAVWLNQYLKNNQNEHLNVILTPPTGEILTSALIASIKDHQVGRVLRVFPEAYSLKEELKKWKRNDFIIRKCIPISYQNCTSPMVIVLFAPDRDGVLKKKKAKVVKKQETPTIRFIQK